MVRTREAPLAEQRKQAVEAICRTRAPLPEWDLLESEIAETHELLDHLALGGGLAVKLPGRLFI